MKQTAPTPAKKSKPLNVSTKTGDGGMTVLANGVRLRKDDRIFEVLGAVDELNSWLGLIAAKFENDFGDHKQFLFSIQDTLFYLGAQVAESPTTRLELSSLKKLEETSTSLQNSMAVGWHSRFLLPGGTELGGYLDVARTVCRRAERSLVAYMHQSSRADHMNLPLKYLNRLSDYLYVLRCFVNHRVEYPEKQFVKRD